MTDEELSEIERRAEAARKSPWRSEEIGGGHAVQWFCRGEWRDEDRWELLGRCDAANKTPVFGRNEAAFIAHAREDVPKLIAEIRFLRMRLDD